MPKTFTVKQHAIKRAVFWPALIIIAAVALVCIVFPSEAGELLETALDSTVSTLGWYLTLCVTAFFTVLPLHDFFSLQPDQTWTR